MPLPLVWLGAGVAALYAGSKLSREQQKYDGHIKHFPGECQLSVMPVNGAVVCCGIYEVFQHTGIWFDGEIIELKGNGLVRAISPERFIDNRSGNRIYIACNSDLQPLVDAGCATRAASRVFEYQDYDVIDNNCHRFTLQCVFGKDVAATRFAAVNEQLNLRFETPIHWQPIDLD